MTEKELIELAKKQLLDYRSYKPGSCFSNPNFSLGIKKAYFLQDTVTNLRIAEGEKVIGYKVGCTGPGTSALFGMNGPIRGTLFRGEALKTGVKINSNKFCNLAIEGEMALSLDDHGNIKSVLPVIELHNFIFRGPKKTLSELIANNGINAGVVLPNQKWYKSRKFFKPDAKLSVKIDNSVVASGSLWPTNGGPEDSLNWLKKNLIEFGIKLLPNHLILAGTALGLYPVEEGNEVALYIDNILAVKCSIQKNIA
tara:strand:+ start:132 stop:893 length:762 start_codon:yes stop_codon:yes gene_type:complete